jgi:predicted alpha/beta superfamily hydrolase
MRIIIITLLISQLCTSNYSQSSSIQDANTLGTGHIISIKSRYVKEETYVIKIHLPSGYETTQKKYPVLYILDGDRSFGMTRDMAEWLKEANEIDDLIIVGIGYGENVNDRIKRQIRDFTPTPDITRKGQDFEDAGGAKSFLSFIQKELIPTIESRYPTNERKVFVGFDFGALFGAFALLSNPKLFSDYVLISPLLLWDRRFIFKIEQAYATLHKDMEASVILIFGLFDSGENVILPSIQFSEIIQNRKYPGLSIATRQYDRETHYSVYPIALQYSIVNFFKKTIDNPIK